MMTRVALLVVLSQFARSKLVDDDPQSPCLYWREGTRVVFHQNVDGNPETGGSEFAAVARALGTWQQEMERCGSLTLEDGPRTESRRVGYDEKSASNENIVVFRQRMCGDVVPQGDACLKDDDCGNAWDCWQHGPSAIAITTTSFNPYSGEVLDSDVELDTPRFLFTTVDAPPCAPGNYALTCVATDVQNTMTHEFGHSLGLTHVATPGSTMAFDAPPGETSKRALDADSQRFVCEVYPAGQPSRACVVKPLGTETLKPAGTQSCAAVPGALWLGLAALGLARRRRR